MSNKPLYYYMPSWALSQMLKKQCTKCGTLVQKQDIIAIGIRDFGGEFSPFCEHRCSKCEWRIMTSFTAEIKTNVEDLCYMMIKEMHFKRSTSSKFTAKRQRPVSQITDNEVKTFLSEFRKNTSHEDFMKQIGANEYHRMLQQKKKNED